MPIEHRIERELGLIVTQALGEVTDADVAAYGQAVNSDPGTRFAGRELIDGRGVTKISITSECVKRLVEANRLAGQRARNLRTAIVAADDAAFGLARMYEMLSEPDFPFVRAYRTLEDARLFLALPAWWKP
ncbi:MAG: hypothetical protein HY291_15465 [Planctomycetes bacterium]|nr:hypothetical protein [Planctomycetota bacterium]